MLNIHQLPAFSIVPNQVSICSGTTTTLSASGADTYTWSPANDITNPHDSSINVAPTVNTTYKVILKDVICNVTDTLTSAVTLKPSPSTTVSKTNNVDCVIGQSALTATGGTQYAWSPSGTLSNPNIANPVATPTETTVYHVIVTNAEGCSVEDSIEVQVIIGSVENGYLLPTAFTPNNDGNNDCFGIKKWGPVTNLDFTIYNRLGNPIFHTTNPGDCWDGTFKGKKQAAGTYIYQISAKTLCGSISRRGTVILIP
jgi:gliding motility-associated-like protein